jgi:hypothetical protein
MVGHIVSFRPPGESRDPLIRISVADRWIPTFVGMTVKGK